MQLGAANRVTCSAIEVLYPVKWDQGCARHERDLFWSISETPDILEHTRHTLFSGVLYLDKPNKSSPKGM